MIIEKQNYREKSDQIRKAENETETFHIKKYDTQFIQKVIQYRLEKKWKRVDLARFLNVKETIITEFETGKAVYDSQFQHKLKMKLKL